MYASFNVQQSQKIGDDEIQCIQGEQRAGYFCQLSHYDGERNAFALN